MRRVFVFVTIPIFASVIIVLLYASFILNVPLYDKAKEKIGNAIFESCYETYDRSGVCPKGCAFFTGSSERYFKSKHGGTIVAEAAPSQCVSKDEAKQLYPNSYKQMFLNIQW